MTSTLKEIGGIMSRNNEHKAVFKTIERVNVAVLFFSLILVNSVTISSILTGNCADVEIGKEKIKTRVKDCSVGSSLIAQNSSQI